VNTFFSISGPNQPADYACHKNVYDFSLYKCNNEPVTDAVHPNEFSSQIYNPPPGYTPPPGIPVINTDPLSPCSSTSPESYICYITSSTLGEVLPFAPAYIEWYWVGNAKVVSAVPKVSPVSGVMKFCATIEYLQNCYYINGCRYTNGPVFQYGLPLLIPCNHTLQP
jgi:hypothetical protein